MTRRSVLGALAVVAGLAVLWLAIDAVLGRDRDAAQQALAQDRLQTLDGAARALGGDLDAIGKDLALVATLIDEAPSPETAERELRALMAVKHQYLVLEARRDGGAAVRVIAPGMTAPGVPGTTGAPAGAELAATAAPVIDRTLETARRAPGELHISPGLSDRDDAAAWYRVFARRTHASPIAVAAVIDMRLLVAPPELLRVGPSRLLVLSAHGVPAPASDPTMARRALAEPELARLLGDARAKRAGTQLVGAAAALRLDLPDGPAVAAAVPIPIDADTPWVLMLVTSTESLAARHAALVRRIAVGGALGLLLVIAATVYVVRNARRAAALEERLRHAELLAHLTEKAERILEHIPNGVLALDERGVVTACNQGFAASASSGGRARAEVVGCTLDELFAHAPGEHLAAVRGLVEAARTAGAPRTLRRTRLALLGAETYVTLHAIPLAHTFRPANGRDVASLLVLDDETALQRSEDRLLRSEKLATAGQVAAGIAHEIGTPLGVARGRAEMSLARGAVDEGDARNLRTIVERIDYVSRLIQQLLDYLRPHAPQVRTLDAGQSLHAVAELLEPQATSRAVRLAVDLGEATRLRADPGQLQQLLVNLAMNAIDACEPGGSVTLRAQARGGATVIEVADDGRGIPAEDRAHVFDPFFTTKKGGSGTGLGLWVVAQLARAHDAEIEVDSRVGAGTTFRIVWPAERGLA